MIALGCATPASAAIFDRDDRIMVGDRLIPVGIVESSRRRYGSGFLIDHCHVLTARHVIGDGDGDGIIGRHIRFRLQPTTAATSANSSPGTVIAAGAHVVRRGDYSGDWALIRIARCLGARFGYYPIASQGFYSLGGSARLRPGLTAMGYPRDRGGRLLVIDPQCEARQRTTIGLRHDCASTAGNSGGPLLAWNESSSRYEAIAINVAAVRHAGTVAFSVDHANVAVELGAIRLKIAGATAPSAPPASQR